MTKNVPISIRNYFPGIIIICKAVSRNPTFGLRSSNAIGLERHVIAEGYKSLKTFVI